MLFTQIEFFFFFLVTIIFLLVAKNHKAQKVYLLLASYYFYGYWDWRFLGLIFVITIINYFAGRGIKRATSIKSRKRILIISLIGNLGILGFFKYFNFFIESTKALISPLGWDVQTLNIILPVGISFYTFQSLSYTMDVYYGKFEACDNFSDFALFAAFFPQLLSGPIVRARDFLPQLATPRELSWGDTFWGFRKFTYGFFKKVFIANRLAYFIDIVFANSSAFDGLTIWVSVFAYAIQIYCDFSGYSDMAIGIARVMGYKYNENFNMPYIAISIVDFWRRWHISLSSWLKDYLYIPLGGNRKGSIRTYFNLMLTMTLGGLWHGAAWTFVAWGVLHGFALCINKLFTGYFTNTKKIIGNHVFSIFSWAITMMTVMVGWVFFRSQNLSSASIMLKQMFFWGPGIRWLYPWAIFLLSIMILIHIIYAFGLTMLFELNAKKWYTPIVLLFLMWIVIIWWPEGFQPFIYFQF